MLQKEKKTLNFVKLSANAQLPTKNSPDAAGFNLYR